MAKRAEAEFVVDNLHGPGTGHWEVRETDEEAGPFDMTLAGMNATGRQSGYLRGIMRSYCPCEKVWHQGEYCSDCTCGAKEALRKL